MGDLPASIFESVAGGRAALVRHSSGGILRATGRDAIRFLHAMLSNDIEGLPVGTVRSALLLSRKGRVLSMLRVLRAPDQLWLVTAADTAAEVREVLEKHVIADDVEVTDCSQDMGELSVEGPDAASVVSARGFPVPAKDHFESGPGGELWCGGGDLGAHGFRVIGLRDRLDALESEIDLPVLEPAPVHALYVAAARPRYGIDVTDRNFPQEARLEGDAVSFRKGCYVGQEIVARIQSRGAVNRLLVPLRFEGSIEAGAELSCEGRARLGTLTSVAELPDGSFAALGYVAADLAQGDLRVEAGGVRGRIGPLEE